MKVRNWHKRSTGRCLEHNVSMLYVSSTHAPTEEETAHISIKREDGMHMDVILSREEFLKFKNEVDWCPSRWLGAAQQARATDVTRCENPA